MSITPTWEHYGTHDDSAYPELWGGCVGAWAPCLGPSGGVLYDLSRSEGRNGALVLSQGTAWKSYQGIPVLYFDGVAGSGISVGTTGSRFFNLREHTLLARVLTLPGGNSDYYGIFSSSYTIPYAYGLRWQNAKITSYVDNVFLSEMSASPTDVLMHYASTYSKSKNVRELYKNGLVDNTTSAGTFSPTSTDTIWIGADYDNGSSRVWKGYIAEIAFFSRALSADEIYFHSQNVGAMFYPRRPRRFYSFADVSNRRRRFFLGAAA